MGRPRTWHLTGDNFHLLAAHLFLTVGLLKLSVLNHTSPDIVTESVHFQLPLERVSGLYFLVQGLGHAFVELLQDFEGQGWGDLLCAYLFVQGIL